MSGRLVAVIPASWTRYRWRGSRIDVAWTPWPTNRIQKSQSSYTYSAPMPQSRNPPTCAQALRRNRATVETELSVRISGKLGSNMIQREAEFPKHCKEGQIKSYPKTSARNTAISKYVGESKSSASKQQMYRPLATL